MMPKAVQDAGYTAVGLGVLALQQVQVQRRTIARRASAVVGGVKARATPVTGRLERVPRLAAPVGRLVGGGKALLCQALRPAGR
jgi:hypothetical protein